MYKMMCVYRLYGVSCAVLCVGFMMIRLFKLLSFLLLFNFHGCFVSSFGNIRVFNYSSFTPTHTHTCTYHTHICILLTDLSLFLSLSSLSPTDVMSGGNGGQENTHIGFYQFERVIGKGNFAVVKLATHSITDIKVGLSLSLSLSLSLPLDCQNLCYLHVNNLHFNVLPRVFLLSSIHYSW